jgi:hypothetical protein
MKHDEHNLQVACVRWFRTQHPKKARLLFAIPNGAKLSGSPLQRAKAWKRLEAEGAQAGVADLFLSIARGNLHGLYIETKTPSGRQSPAQKEFEAAVIEEGFGYAMPRSIENFMQIIASYLKSGVY